MIVFIGSFSAGHDRRKSANLRLSRLTEVADENNETFPID
jgi:hypothetical protein